MIPWETIAQTSAPDGEPLTLVRRGDEWVVRAGRSNSVLMSSRQHGSEEAMARLGFELAPSARDVLVGGLGLGFTARAVLDRLPSDGALTVAEFVPDLVAWNRDHVGALAQRPLDDARTQVFVGDVRAALEASPAGFDLVLLDVDNGPTIVAHAGNASLYTDAGVRLCHRALRPGGLLVVWSAAIHPPYVKALKRAGFRAEARQVSSRDGKRGGEHVLFVGRKGSLRHRRRLASAWLGLAILSTGRGACLRALSGGSAKDAKDAEGRQALRAVIDRSIVLPVDWGIGFCRDRGVFPSWIPHRCTNPKLGSRR